MTSIEKGKREGERERISLVILRRKGWELGGSQRVWSLALLHRNKLWLHGSDKETCNSQSCLRLQCPNVGMILARFQKGLVKMGDPEWQGQRAQGSSTLSWCYNRMTSVHAKGTDTSVGWEMDLVYLKTIKKCSVFCAPGLWTEIYTTALISSCNDIIYRCILWIFPIVFHSILCLWWQAPFKTSVVILLHAPNVTLCTRWVFGKYWCVAQGPQDSGSHS